MMGLLRRLEMRETDQRWLSFGRDYAWINAAAFLVGTVLFLAVTLGLFGGTAPSYEGQHTLAADSRYVLSLFNYTRGVYLPNLVSELAFVVGFLALIPLGMALWHHLGADGSRQQLMATGYAVGGVFGAAAQAIGVAVIRTESASGWEKVTPEGLVTANGTISILNELATWLDVVAFLLIGLASYRFARLVMEERLMARSLAWLAMAESALLLLGIVVSITGPFALFQAFVGLGGGVIGPIWAAWVGVELRRAGAAAQSPVSSTMRARPAGT
jgi:hypothetical protein